MKYAHVPGFNDAPFARTRRGDVIMVEARYWAHTLTGVISGTARREGVNAAAAMVRVVENSRFAAHAQLITLQGIVIARFNVMISPACGRGRICRSWW